MQPLTWVWPAVCVGAVNTTCRCVYYIVRTTVERRAEAARFRGLVHVLASCKHYRTVHLTVDPGRVRILGDRSQFNASWLRVTQRRCARGSSGRR